MGFLSTETFEDVERVRKQRERRELAEIPPGKYIVLKKTNMFGWDTVHETRNGMTHEKAKFVYEYQVKFCDIEPKKLLIVKVED